MKINGHEEMKINDFPLSTKIERVLSGLLFFFFLLLSFLSHIGLVIFLINASSPQNTVTMYQSNL